MMIAITAWYRHVRNYQNWPTDQSKSPQQTGLYLCCIQPFLEAVCGPPIGENLKRSWRNSVLPLVGDTLSAPVSPVRGYEMSRQSEGDFHQEENSCQESLKLCHSGRKINTNNLKDITDLEVSPSPPTHTKSLCYCTCVEERKKNPRKMQSHSWASNTSSQSLLAHHSLPDILSSQKGQQGKVSAHKTEWIL